MLVAVEYCALNYDHITSSWLSCFKENQVLRDVFYSYFLLVQLFDMVNSGVCFRILLDISEIVRL